MNIRSSLKILVVVLAAVIAVSSGMLPAQAKGKNQAAGVITQKNETIYYPSGWKVAMPNGTADIRAGLVVYSRYYFSQAGRPAGEKNWASISIRKYNCKDCMNSEVKAGLADYVNDKNCAMPKCEYRENGCPVHSSGNVPPSRVGKSCPSTTRYPRMIGGVCGRYYSKEKMGDTTYYYFEGETEGTGFSAPGDELTEITAVFMKNGLIYSAELVCPKGEYDNYKAQLAFVLKNLLVKGRQEKQ